MHDARGMRRRECVGDLNGVAERRRERQPLPGNQLVQWRPAISSMAMKSVPSTSSMSWTVTMLG